MGRALSDVFKQKLEQALRLDLSYSQRFQLNDATPSAVLVLLGQDDTSHRPSILITRRTDSVETHKGQMAFPGGVCDPEDFEKQGELTTALRETREEVGIEENHVELFGKLPELWTPSGFKITPVVGWLAPRLSETRFAVNHDEIADAFWVSLEELEAPGTYRLETHRSGVFSYPIHVYQVGENRIWGATGAILWNLIERLKQVG